MDHFGIGAALLGVMRVYFQTSRATGRTTSLVESLKTGDRVVFADVREAKRVQRMCLERGQTVDCITVEPSRLHTLYERGIPQGRLLFDHTWLEQFYLEALTECTKRIDHIQREGSGFGEAHLETRRRALERAKWGF